MKSLSKLTREANYGYFKSQADLGLSYFYGHHGEYDVDKGLKWLTKSADHGYSDAQCDLGWIYVNSDKIEKDYKAAMKWYQKASDQGSERGAVGVADLYFFGRGVTKNERTSRLIHDAINLKKMDPTYLMECVESLSERVAILERKA